MEKIVKHINENLEKLILPDGNIKVGNKYPYKLGEKGAVMELLPDGYYYIKLIVDGLDEIDVIDFREGDISFKILVSEDKAYILLRFGTNTLLHEILFDPTLYPDREKTRESLKESNIIYCVLIEGLSEKVQGIKIFNFPLDAFDKLVKGWEKALEKENYTEEFRIYCTNFFSEDISFWWENIS